MSSDRYKRKVGRLSDPSQPEIEKPKQPAHFKIKIRSPGRPCIARIWLEGRGNNIRTILNPATRDMSYIEFLSSWIKKRLCCGGSIKSRPILLQGDQIKNILQISELLHEKT
jgi:translation initiation factor 1 (eIF-1/SUI1)